MPLERVYDEMADITRWYGQARRLPSNEAQSSIHAAAYGVHIPRENTKSVIFFATRHAPEWGWLSNDSMIILIDGAERFYPPCGLKDTKVITGSQLYEEVHFELGLDLASKIASSKLCKVRIGSVDFELPAGTKLDLTEILTQLR